MSSVAGLRCAAICITLLHVKRSTKTKRISVPLSSDELDALQESATKQERSLSWMAAYAIRFFLAESRKGSRAVAAFETPMTKGAPE